MFFAVFGVYAVSGFLTDHIC